MRFDFLYTGWPNAAPLLALALVPLLCLVDGRTDARRQAPAVAELASTMVVEAVPAAMFVESLSE